MEFNENQDSPYFQKFGLKESYTYFPFDINSTC